MFLQLPSSGASCWWDIWKPGTGWYESFSYRFSLLSSSISRNGPRIGLTHSLPLHVWIWCSVFNQLCSDVPLTSPFCPCWSPISYHQHTIYMYRSKVKCKSKLFTAELFCSNCFDLHFSLNIQSVHKMCLNFSNHTSGPCPLKLAQKYWHLHNMTLSLSFRWLNHAFVPAITHKSYIILLSDPICEHVPESHHQWQGSRTITRCLSS